MQCTAASRALDPGPCDVLTKACQNVPALTTRASPAPSASTLMTDICPIARQTRTSNQQLIIHTRRPSNAAHRA
eukprot:9618039-Alexandrium_andersonii.AAC.1